MELGIPELTDEQIETLCDEAEKAARRHIFYVVDQKQVETLNISVEAEGTKPVSLTVEVDLQLLPKALPQVNQKALVDEAVKKAFEAIETYLRTLK
ncbi:MAG: DUF3194 domain-containing protein [Candidatus Bathyarchaeota archaeon]|nr:DUF3194 domain-containing protein [Candidatus Bathyarchaeota archaeon]